MVEVQVQCLDAKSPPNHVGEAVIEILQQTTGGRSDSLADPPTSRHTGTYYFIIKQAAK